MRTIESFHKGMDTDKKIREVKKEDLPGKKLLLDQIQEAEKKTETSKSTAKSRSRAISKTSAKMLYRQIMSNVGSGHSSNAPRKSTKMSL